MDKGYNVEEFIKYLKTLKSNGDDINVWSYEEIKMNVMHF